MLFSNFFFAKIKRQAARIILGSGFPVLAQKPQANPMNKAKTKKKIGGTNQEGLDVPLVPSAQEAKRGHFKFRPLTRNEKKEFMRALDSDGKRMLAELGARTPVTPRLSDLTSVDAASPRPSTRELTD